jgi:threonine/homoserine/homoserine lactone efflux protein
MLAKNPSTSFGYSCVSEEGVLVESISVSLAAFIAAAGLLTITPGLDTALVLRTAAASSSRQAALAGLGIAAGCFAWGALVALGLGALLMASQLAFSILKWIGAAYLVWTGIKMLRSPRETFVVNAERPHQDKRSAFGTGLFTNLLNPKIGVFYVSFLPQFVPHGVSAGPYILLLATMHALLGLVWFACLIAATRPIGGYLRRPTVVKGADRLTGAAFVAFGIGLALQSRRP